MTSNSTKKSKTGYWKLLALGGALVTATIFVGKIRQDPKPQRQEGKLTALEPTAQGPWPQARYQRLSEGVDHWFAISKQDGTTFDLLSFDFSANSRLKFELYDADLNETPKTQKADNRFAYWNSGLGVTSQRLNEQHDLVAAWNGGFWGLLNRKPRTADRAFHLAPIVHHGRVFYNGMNHRWTWGAKVVGGRPVFSLAHLPDNQTLVHKFDFATGTLQALLKDGQPLELLPYPRVGEKPPRPPLPSNPQQAGGIPVLDHMHTSRVGVGWTRSNRLFVLVVKEPDGEVPSRAAVNARKRGVGGWTLAEHQKFWLMMQRKFGVENAVGLDGGDVAQAVFRQPDGNFTLLVPRIALPESVAATFRLEAQPNFNEPSVKNLKGGALSYFVVREKSG